MLFFKQGKKYILFLFTAVVFISVLFVCSRDLILERDFNITLIDKTEDETENFEIGIEFSEDYAINIDNQIAKLDKENEEDMLNQGGLLNNNLLPNQNTVAESDDAFDTTAEKEPEMPKDSGNNKKDEKKGTLYDVPLSQEKQEYVEKMAKEFGIPAELILGVMYTESRYKAEIVSKNGKYIGIMQIAKSNLKMLNSKFGITDLRDYKQNVKSGAYFLSYFYKKYDGDINKVLMCYHCGEGGAQRLWRNGKTVDGYCNKVAAEMNRIIESGSNK